MKSDSDQTIIERNRGNSDIKRKPKKPNPPPKYRVIYYNDDFTPMEFVTWSLRTFFNKNEMVADSLTLEIHKLGSAVVGIYDYQTAEQRIYEVMTSAKENEYPLKVTGEPE